MAKTGSRLCGASVPNVESLYNSILIISRSLHRDVYLHNDEYNFSKHLYPFPDSQSPAGILEINACKLINETSFEQFLS